MFILVIVVMATTATGEQIGQAASSVVTQEFASQETCLAAGEKIEGFRSNIEWECVEK